MPTSDVIRYTEQGIKTFKDLPSRLEETRKAGEAVDAKLVVFYLTMGQYDAVVVSEAPDDETVAGSRLLPADAATSVRRRCEPSLRTKQRNSRPRFRKRFAAPNNETGRPDLSPGSQPHISFARGHPTNSHVTGDMHGAASGCRRT